MNVASPPTQRDALRDHGTAEMQLDKPSVLVIEPNFGGHRWRYVEWIVKALHDAGYACVLATDAENSNHPLIGRLSRAAPAVSLFLHAREVRSGAAAALQRLSRPGTIAEHFGFHAVFSDIHRAVTGRAAVDMVIVPYGDTIIDAIAVLGSPFGATPWLGILMRRAFHLRDMGVLVPPRRVVDAIKRRLFVRALQRGNAAALLTIDPTLSAWRTRNRSLPPDPPVRYLPDPFPDAEPLAREIARAQLGISASQSILVYGAITSRKGIGTLLQACEQAAQPPFVIIAGAQDAEVRQLLAGLMPHLRTRVLEFNGFVSPELETQLFSACDAVWLGYQGHYGMSGVLVQAYRFGKPVIATAQGLIGWFARRENLGPVLASRSPTAVLAAIDTALHHPHDASAGIEHAHSILARHTVADFKQAFLQTLSEALLRRGGIDDSHSARAEKTRR